MATTLVLWRYRTLAINPTLYANGGVRSRARTFARVVGADRHQRACRCWCTLRCRRRHRSRELIALARRDPGKLDYASSRPRQGIHLAAELFAEHGRYQAHAYPLPRQRPCAQRSASAATSYLFQLMCRPPSASLVKQGAGTRVTGHALTCRSPPTVGRSRSAGYEAVCTMAIVVPSADRPAHVVPTTLNAALRVSLAFSRCGPLIATGARALRSRRGICRRSRRETMVGIVERRRLKRIDSAYDLHYYALVGSLSGIIMHVVAAVRPRVR